MRMTPDQLSHGPDKPISALLNAGQTWKYFIKRRTFGLFAAVICECE